MFNQSARSVYVAQKAWDVLKTASRLVEHTLSKIEKVLKIKAYSENVLKFSRDQVQVDSRIIFLFISIWECKLIRWQRCTQIQSTKGAKYQKQTSFLNGYGNEVKGEAGAKTKFAQGVSDGTLIPRPSREDSSNGEKGWWRMEMFSYYQIDLPLWAL